MKYMVTVISLVEFDICSLELEYVSWSCPVYIIYTSASPWETHLNYHDKSSLKLGGGAV